MKGRVAIVTGAGRGIGRATALLLAERGARVMAVSRTEEQLAELAPIEYLAESVATEEGCARIVAETRRRLGPIEILVNNAGVGSGLNQPVQEQERDAWLESLAINLDGPFHLTRLALPDMIERGFGRIVMVGSTSSEVGAPSTTAYTAAKHGLNGLMRATAHDAGRYGVTCNAVLPGWVRTAMSDVSAGVQAKQRGISVEQVWRERAASYPAKRVVEPEEIAATIAFLASDEASGINGEAITVALGSPY